MDHLAKKVEQSTAQQEMALQQGAHAQLTGLVARPDLNGSKCVLRTYDRARDRWLVKTEDGQTYNVYTQNLAASTGAQSSGGH